MEMRSIQIQKKKGMSIGDMYPAVLTIVLIGVVLGVGLFVLSTLHTAVNPARSGAQNDINTTTGTTTLDDASLAQFNVSAITAINYTDGESVTNFTFTGPGVITWGQNIVDYAELDTINTTYTYTYDEAGSAPQAVTTTITGLATFADWIAIIVVVIAAAIVLGVVLSSFGSRRNRI